MCYIQTPRGRNLWKPEHHHSDGCKFLFSSCDTKRTVVYLVWNTNTVRSHIQVLSKPALLSVFVNLFAVLTQKRSNAFGMLHTIISLSLPRVFKTGIFACFHECKKTDRRLHVFSGEPWYKITAGYLSPHAWLRRGGAALFFLQCLNFKQQLGVCSSYKT